VRIVRGAFADRHLLLRAAERLPDATQPALLVWARRDRVMPPDHGRRLAELFQNGRLVQVEDSYTLIPLDQPTKLAQVIREFTNTAGAT
jgi:pimeloyl-ACP methyl ester carboxylesterase